MANNYNEIVENLRFEKNNTDKQIGRLLQIPQGMSLGGIVFVSIGLIFREFEKLEFLGFQIKLIHLLIVGAVFGTIFSDVLSRFYNHLFTPFVEEYHKRMREYFLEKRFLRGIEKIVSLENKGKISEREAKRLKRDFNTKYNEKREELF